MPKYIDADVLMRYLDELRRDATEPQYVPQAASLTMAQINAYDDCKRIVERMLAADVKPLRHGCWKERQYPLPLSDGSKIKYFASCCGTTWDVKSNYCPYCGTKMDGGSE